LRFFLTEPVKRNGQGCIHVAYLPDHDRLAAYVEKIGTAAFLIRPHQHH
jgi:hypothetical protein